MPTKIPLPAGHVGRGIVRYDCYGMLAMVEMHQRGAPELRVRESSSMMS